MAGEFVCFLGPSGCGKTTLLRSIAGLDPQTSGTIEQGGRDVSNLPPAARDFGIVFQSYALFPNLTVAANVGYGLTSRRQPRAQTAARVAELLALVGLADQGAKYPGQLSGGQQQRVALARALAISPGLLLLDEPLSALDARVRVRLRQEIKELQRRVGVTTIMVTHDQEEALTMADRIVVMNHGRIEQIGSPSEIYRNPATAFVADFIGAMTFIPGEALDPTHVQIGSLVFETTPYSIRGDRPYRSASAPRKSASAISPPTRPTASIRRSTNSSFSALSRGRGSPRRGAAIARPCRFLGQCAPRSLACGWPIAHGRAAAGNLARLPGTAMTTHTPRSTHARSRWS